MPNGFLSAHLERLRRGLEPEMGTPPRLVPTGGACYKDTRQDDPMNLEIPDEILRATHLSPAELRVEIAVMLFQKEKLTLGRAAELADMGQLEFQRLLASREIPIHYDVEDLEEDLHTLDRLRERT